MVSPGVEAMHQGSLEEVDCRHVCFGKWVNLLVPRIVVVESVSMPPSPTLECSLYCILRFNTFWPFRPGTRARNGARSSRRISTHEMLYVLF